MSRWLRFWQATESIPGPEATLLEWQLHMGDDCDITHFPLRPIDRHASSLPISLNSSRPRHEVVRHGNGDYEAVDPRTGYAVAISEVDILIYRLDLGAVLKQIATVFPLVRMSANYGEIPQLWRVGEYRPFSGYSFPAFFTIRNSPDDFQRVLEALAAREKQFLFIAPTRRFLSPSGKQILERASAFFMPLSEIIAIDSSNAWSLTSDGGDHLRSFLELVIPESKFEDGRAFFETPPNVRWSDLSIKFRDRETLTAKIGDVSKVLTYTEMGMADGRNKSPTKQWELLYSFAEAYGHLTWESSNASRKNQKRCEYLVRNLRDFFRIEGDPIKYDIDSKGWKTMFTVES